MCLVLGITANSYWVRGFAVMGVVGVLSVAPVAVLGAQQDTTGWRTDPRVGLAGGFSDAKDAIKNLRHVSHAPKADGW